MQLFTLCTMAQILDPLPSGSPDRILCCYINATSKIQVARITNLPDWYFERVVFPGQRLVFETMPKALLEIHTGMMASAIISDTIPCERLIMAEADAGQVQAEPELDPFIPDAVKVKPGESGKATAVAVAAE